MVCSKDVLNKCSENKNDIINGMSDEWVMVSIYISFLRKRMELLRVRDISINLNECV